MLRQARSTTVDPNASLLPQPRQGRETNTSWMTVAYEAMFGTGTMASEPRDGWTCIALLGGKDTESFRLRVAQAQLRADLLPSFWSDVVLVAPVNGSIKGAEVTHVPLAQH